MRLATLRLLASSLVITMLFALSQWVWGHVATTTPVITAAEVLAFQNNASGQDKYVIVDVRSQAETDVSMIPGALTQSEFEKSAHLHQGKQIIVYCTIGVRSGNYAASLNQQGWNASNYKGSILDWCAHDLPLVANGSGTNKVHTYNEWYSAPAHYVGVH